MTRVYEHWHISKPAVRGSTGMVASQHYMASEAGARVLGAGGNAVDAAIATGLALGAVEPWMSGIGGGGYMVVHLASGDTRVVEFGMRAPLAASPADYPLAGAGENPAEAFNWPKVVDDVNVEGALSIAVPTYLRGIELAHREFGSVDWQALIEPACQLAERGLPVDWYTASKINTFARSLRSNDETRRVYLPDGLPPAQNLDGTLGFRVLGELPSTLRHLQAHGPSAFYSGALAERVVDDLRAVGSKISLEDLAAADAAVTEPLSGSYRGARVFTAGPLTAGPSLLQALERLAVALPAPGRVPDAAAFVAFADSLLATYAHRLLHLGEGAPSSPGATSHLCVADAGGNVVALTQTIMSGFGARVMLPASGVLMNNGMMWFDPRPGGPNSVVGGGRPLCNMCPTVVSGADGSVTALGACGGRRIFPAVFQLVSFLVDYAMDVDAAVHAPRLDNSGTRTITLMDSAPLDVQSALASRFEDVRLRPNGVAPNLFALPQVVRRGPDGRFEGACVVSSPHARAVAP